MTAKVVDKDGNVIPLNVQATSKLISKEVRNGETHYIGKTDIEAKVNVKLIKKPSVAQLLLANTAYAASGGSGSGSDYVISWINQHETAYWDYVWGGNSKYYKWTGMTGYWTRDTTRYYAHHAYFKTAYMGVPLNGGSTSGSATSG